MASIEQFQRVERRFRELMYEAGLPMPDEVNYHEDGGGEVEFRWYDQKLVVVVELDEYTRQAVRDPPV